MKRLLLAILLLAAGLPASAQTMLSGNSGSGAPVNTVGQEGQYFFNINNGQVYGPKSFNKWPTPPASPSYLGIGTGTSGGIPYFASSSSLASSAALAANALVIGGGAGAAPSTTTTGAGVLTALGLAPTGTGAMVLATSPTITTPAVTGSLASTATVGTNWNIDCSGTTVVVANGANQALQNGAGMVFIQDQSATGEMAIFLIAGTASSIVSQTGTLYATTPTAGKVSIAWNGAGPYYQINNQQGGSITFALFMLRIRTVGN